MEREPAETNQPPTAALVQPRTEQPDLFNHFEDYVSGPTMNLASNRTRPPTQNRVTFAEDPEGPTLRGFSIFDHDDERESESNAPPPTRFPNELPADEIVRSTAQALPKLTLRFGHSLKYSSLVGDLCRKSLKRADPSNNDDDRDALAENPIDTLNQVCIYG